MSRTKAQKAAFTATRMRMVLIGALTLVLLVMSAGFYLAYSALKTTAANVADVQSAAASVDADLRNLVKLESDMKRYADVVEKTQNIVPDSIKYMYQDQIIKDMTAMAGNAGVTVTAFDFGTSSADGTANSGTAPPTATIPAPGADGSTDVTTTPETTEAAPAAAAPAIQSIFISISLRDTTYENLLRFIYLIENNVSRMQISQLTLSPGTNGMASIDALEVEMYVR